MKTKIIFLSALLLVVMTHSACKRHSEADQSPQTATNSPTQTPVAPPIATNIVQIPSWDHTNDPSISNWNNPNQPTNQP